MGLVFSGSVPPFPPLGSEDSMLAVLALGVAGPGRALKKKVPMSADL